MLTMEMIIIVKMINYAGARAQIPTEHDDQCHTPGRQPHVALILQPLLSVVRIILRFFNFQEIF